nr:hypothetical protein GCM10020063_037360 [Dactylosporangium thailandense]
MEPSTSRASTGQRLLWILDRNRGADGALNCPTLCRVTGELDVAALGSALTALTARHESLRTTFTGRGPLLTQLINPPRPVEPVVVDLRATADPAAALRRALAGELATRIDPTRWPVRVTVWRTGDEAWLICINAHHLVTDAWSCAVLFRELWQLYEGGTPEPVACQYRDFADWQRGREGGGMTRHAAYWRAKLAGARPPVLPAAADGDGPPAGGSATIAADIPEDVVRRLRAVGRQERTTLFTVMLALFYATLYRITGQADLTVSSVFANRVRPEHGQVVGFLANLVLLRTTVPGEDFAELLRRTHGTVRDAFIHQELPYHLLPLDPQRGAGRPDDLVFQMLAEPAERRRVPGAWVEAYVPDGVATRFRAEFALVPRQQGIQVLLFHAGLAPDVAAALTTGYADIAAEVAARVGGPGYGVEGQPTAARPS